MLAPALALSLIFAVIVHHSDEALLMTVGGALTLLSIVVINHRLHSMRLDRKADAVGAGVISAERNVGAGIGGPPIALCTLNAGRTVEEARSTTPTVFLIQNVIALWMLGRFPSSLLFPSGGTAAGS